MTTGSATAIIYLWGSSADRKLFLFRDHRWEIVSYLHAVDKVQLTISSADSEDERKEAESVIQIAVSRLAKEFRNILIVHDRPNLSSTNSTTMTDSASSNYEIYEDDYVHRNTLRADAIIPKLADKANEIRLKFANDLDYETSPMVHAEPIHRLSRYVMHYVSKLCDHKQTLMRLSGTGTISGSFSLHVVWIIMRLLSKLDVKLKQCRDPPANRFFAMNNFHYIIQNIQACPELLEIVADDNLNKLNAKFQKARSDYLKLTFDVVLRNLRDEGVNKIKILSFRVVKLKDRLKRFNYEFEKHEKELGKVVVPDFGLVLELRKLIVEMVVTAYASFLVHTKKVARLETYVKYSVEEIESAIQGFYDCR
ncbi:putative exocyst complex component Exo70, cullin repeat-like-containing domain superfamily [Helianthus annuus]|nr:putative exocyst complex component Exo70, cullin repeat-like-containing domain superfamily [Helianthus annuus]